MGIINKLDCFICFFHVSFYVFLIGICSATKVLLKCNTQYSNREPYMTALDEYMQPNQAVLAIARRMRIWMVSGLFA